MGTLRGKLYQAHAERGKLDVFLELFESFDEFTRYP